MAAKRGITLYHSPNSRAFTAYWMLEELGVDFDVRPSTSARATRNVGLSEAQSRRQKVPAHRRGGGGENPIAIYTAEPLRL